MGAAEVVQLEAFRARRPRQVEEPWVSKQQIARHFAVTPTCIDNWCRAGMPFEYVGGRRRFKVSVCEAWHEARR
jgi:hypothetical protein